MKFIKTLNNKYINAQFVMFFDVDWCALTYYARVNTSLGFSEQLAAFDTEAEAVAYLDNLVAELNGGK